MVNVEKASNELREKWRKTADYIAEMTLQTTDSMVFDLLLLMAEISHECAHSTTPFRLRGKLQQVLEAIKKENVQNPVRP